MIIAFEGRDGTGKTTQATLLKDHLQRRGLKAEIFHPLEDTPLGRAVHQVFKDRIATCKAAQLALFCAAHIQFFEGRKAGKSEMMILDRSIFSTMAYQFDALSEAGGLRIIQGASAYLVRPDIVFWLHGDTHNGGEVPEDTFEDDHLLQLKLDANYGRVFDSIPDLRCVGIGDGPITEVHSQVAGEVDALLSEGLEVADDAEL